MASECCDPCRTVGDHAEAKGFCTYCNEYLCESCFRCHSRSKSSRHHALLDRDNMPRKSDKLCTSCKSAGNKVTDAGLLSESEAYFCSNCMAVPQRTENKGDHLRFDKDNMPRVTARDIETSVGQLNICDGVRKHKQDKETYAFIRDVDIKAAEDDRDCYIAEMTLVSNTELLLTDYNNKSLKLVDVPENTIKTTLRLQSPPIGITTMSNDQVAVVLENECKIQIVSASGGLFVVKTLSTNGKCVDIKYMNGKLYVSFWEPVKFQILLPDGAVYSTIKLGPEVLKHCILPSYIDVSPDESLLYVSDWKTKKVMCIAMYGDLISVYQGELKGPADISISPLGAVHLCDRDQHAVYKLTSDLREATVVLGDKKQEASPHAMCFNADTQHLYISSGSAQAHYKNYIRIYKWK